MTIIYGLREVGSDEIRYVGYTNQPLAKRLRQHEYKALARSPYGPTEWMLGAGPVEIVRLRACPRHQANKAERAWVERLHKLGHRLTNRHLLPRAIAVAA